MSKSKKSLKPYQEKRDEIILDFRTATLDLWEMLYFGFPILPLVTILLYKIPYPIYFGL